MGLRSLILGWLRRAWGGAEPLGARGEQAAAALLVSRGFRVLGRNIRLPFGEIDILAEDPDGRTVVVVEVKSRWRGRGVTGASAQVAPEASITRRKARTLVRLLDAMVAANGWGARPKRIDVVAVEFFEDGGGARVEARHFRAAVGRPRR